MKQDDLLKPRKYEAVLVGIAGDHSSFCLAPYNLKSYAYSDPQIRHDWEIDIYQEGLSITESGHPGQWLTPGTNLIGFSTYMWGAQYIKRCTSILKDHFPSMKIVLGGPEISHDWIIEGKYNDWPVDYLVAGEGEKTFLEILRHWDTKNFSDRHIPGLAIKLSDGSYRLNEPRSYAPTMDWLPSPFLSGCVDDEVLSSQGVQANIETQRGCSLRCSYCVYHKDMPKIAYQNTERVLDEITYATNKGCKKIRFTDANFSSDLSYAKAIIQGMIDRKIEATLMTELIPGFLDEELAQLFHEYNNLWEWNYVTLGVGVQTINLDVLKRMRRGIRKEKFEETFNLIQKYGIYAKIDLIIGLPGETEQSICETLEYMLKKLKDNPAHLLCCHTMRGLPGTELLEISKDFKQVYSSEFEPHELRSSPALPREAMVRCLRRTAMVFRIINPGWSENSGSLRKEFYDRIGPPHSGAKPPYFRTGVEQIDAISERLKSALPRDSWFAQDDFPYAETWWWEKSANEVSDEQLKRIMGEA